MIIFFVYLSFFMNLFEISYFYIIYLLKFFLLLSIVAPIGAPFVHFFNNTFLNSATYKKKEKKNNKTYIIILIVQK